MSLWSGRRRELRFGVLICMLGMCLSSGIAVAQKAGTLAGTWNVHIQHQSGRTVDEQWIVEQRGESVSGTVKTPRRDFPLEGTVKAGKVHVEVKVAEDRMNIFVGTLNGNVINGTIMQKGDDGEFSAKRQDAK